MKYLRPILPELMMVAIMAAVALVYMSPVFEGKTLPQGDVMHAQDQIVDVEKYQDETGEYPGWTNSAFGGMPTYQLKSPPSRNIFSYLFRILKLYLPGYTAAILFVAMLGFFFLLRTLKLNRWLALAGALAFALSSHHLQLISAGHVNKIYSVAYMAPVIAGMLLVFKRKYLTGGLLTAIGLGIQISTNHVQVTYYLGIMVLVYMLVELVYAIREKYFNHLVKASLVLFAALVLAILPNMTMLLTTYEYTQETTRGKTTLSSEDSSSESGLTVDYMTEWSYGVGETLNLFIPNLYGGSGSTDLGVDSEFFKELQRMGSQNARQMAAGAPTYWGTQPFTSGPHYVGAIVVFLAILGLFLIRGPKRWWLIIILVLSVMLSWGKNFMGLTEFFANNIPLYNKFRDMTNVLIIAQFALPFLAFLGIRSWFYDDKRSPEEKLKKLYLATGIAGGVALIFALMPAMFLSFTGPQDSYYQSLNVPVDALRLDRIGLARKDAFRTLVFVLLGSGLLWFSLKSKVKQVYLFGGLAFLILIDLWAVDRRYLNSDNFVSKSQFDQTTAASPADNFILQDPEVGYRVLDVSSQNPFKYSRPSRFHRSIGGYHGAKLGRYQDLIDNNLFAELQQFNDALRPEANPTIQSVTDSMSAMSVHNMLNTKYIILQTGQQPLTNPYAMGSAWFAEEIHSVEDAAGEMEALGNFDLRLTAIVNDEFSSRVQNLQLGTPGMTNEKIELTEIKPNLLKYSAHAEKDRLAVFSEIWYPHGWEVYIDGEPGDYLRANYLLRALVVPAGDHQIEFRFNPASLKTGQIVALLGSIITLLLILAWLYTERNNILPAEKPED